jgi:uncharacterized protein (DUF1697 family)
MPRHAAFLRGINLGKRRLTMGELKRAFEDFGLADVATFIASGNVVFEHTGSRLADLEARLETHLADSLGFATDTFVRSIADLDRIVSDDRVTAARAAGFNIHVIFLRGKTTAAMERALRAIEVPDDQFHVLGREVMWLRRGRLTDSTLSDRDLAAALNEKTSTMRNLNTIARMVTKFS